MLPVDFFKACKHNPTGECCLAEEYMLIAGICSLLRPRTILEIGTCYGVGTITLLAGTLNAGQKGVHITSIDILLDRRRERIKANFEAAKLANPNCKFVEFVQADSREILPEFVADGRRFELVFLDGDHSDPTVSTDWDNVSKLTDFVILHDTTQFVALRELVNRLRASEEFDILEFSAYPFGHQMLNHPRRKGWALRDDAMPGVSLVRRRSSLGTWSDADACPESIRTILQDSGYLEPPL